jgi:hypothetical protein
MNPSASFARPAAAISALLLLTNLSFAGIQTMVGHHAEGTESPSFNFTNVPPPSRNDAATTAKFTLVSGEADANGGDLDKLHDGKVPTEADAPGDNFFFNAGTSGGKIQVDLGHARDIKQVNTYSWHPSTRGPQVYKLYASAGTNDHFIAAPGTDAELASGGWKLIAQVDTRPSGDEGGGQYGVSISDDAGIIGNYRYLLFDISPTETSDAFGNTFYSEIDVVELNAPAESAVALVVPPFIIKSADGYCEISIDTAKAPELKDWAEQKLGPALAEWYPKIVAMMPSDGFSAPKKFNVVLRPGDGVAATGGTRITANSDWFRGELDREAVGALIHEEVHVVQQYGAGWRRATRAPGWLTEGIPDYIRFFKFEPQSHGADAVWMQHRRTANFNYDGLYRISANFLDYVITHYDPNQQLLAKVNAACRQGKYSDDLWPELTGKKLADLNDEWKATLQKPAAK